MKTRLAPLGFALGALLALAAPAQARNVQHHHPELSATASREGVAPKFAAPCEAIEAAYNAKSKAEAEADAAKGDAAAIATIKTETAGKIGFAEAAAAGYIAEVEAEAAKRVAELKSFDAGTEEIAAVEAEAAEKIAAEKVVRVEWIASIEAEAAKQIAAVEAKAAEWSSDGLQEEALEGAKTEASQAAKNCWEDAENFTEEAAEARYRREHQREMRHLPLLGKQEALRAAASALRRYYELAWSGNPRKVLVFDRRISRTRVKFNFFFRQRVAYGLATPSTWGHVTVWRSSRDYITSQVQESGYRYER